MEFNNDHIVQIAFAATDAAQAKVKELDGDDWFAHALMGTIMAGESAEKFVKLLELLGPEAMHGLAEVVNAANEREVIKQAEEILGGSDVG